MIDWGRRVEDIPSVWDALSAYAAVIIILAAAAAIGLVIGLLWLWLT
jgi:hypothetical protein